MADLDPSLYPYAAVMPAPCGGLGRLYRYRIVDVPQGGQRCEAIFLSTYGGKEHWREVKRLETLDALAAPPVSSPADELNALWIDQAPRFGAVATHFPESLRKRRFVASFWAPEMFFVSPDGREGWYRDLPESPRTRAMLDSRTAFIIRLPRPGDHCKPRFWSPELPRIRIFVGAVSGRPYTCLVEFRDGMSYWPAVWYTDTKAAIPEVRYAPPWPREQVAEGVRRVQERAGVRE